MVRSVECTQLLGFRLPVCQCALYPVHNPLSSVRPYRGWVSSPSLWLFFTPQASGCSSPPILANSLVCPQVDKHGKVQLTNTLGLKGSGKETLP